VKILRNIIVISQVQITAGAFMVS